MREIKKSTKLDNVLYDVRGPVVEEAERMEEAGARILKLNIGNPAPFDFRAPEEMVFDMSRRMRGLLVGEGPVLGAQGHHAVRAAQAHSGRGHR